MSLQKPDVLSFTQATLYAPLIIIFVLYFPTVIYIFYISIRFHGFKSWVAKVMDNPSYFIFPLLTCISFYKRPDLQTVTLNGSRDEMDQKIENGLNAMEEIPSIPIEIIVVKEAEDQANETANNLISPDDMERSEIIEVVSEDTDESPAIENSEESIETSEEETVVVKQTFDISESGQELSNEANFDEFQFSVHQSNVLYFLFAISFVFIIGSDFAIQRARWKGTEIYNSITFKYLFIFLGNLYLWFDFIQEARSRNPSDDNLFGNNHM